MKEKRQKNGSLSSLKTQGLPRMEYYIKESEWEGIFAFLRSIKGLHSRNIQELRCFLEGVWFILRSGSSWRLLPERYGHWRAVHARFRSWSEKGLWKRLFESVQKEPDFENVMIDSTIVRAHACAAGLSKSTQEQEALGRSCGGFSTKIHALVDGLGNPLSFLLTPGQRSDVTQSVELIQDLSDCTVLADKGYDAEAWLNKLQEQGSSAVIPPKKNRKTPRKIDKFLYKERHLIECFFGKLKHYRRIFSRFDKSAAVFLSFICLAGALIWLR